MQSLDSFLTPIAQKPQNQKLEDLNIISTQTNSKINTQKPQMQQAQPQEFEPQKEKDFVDLDNMQDLDTQEQATPRTGFRYLDEKMANGSLSVMDGYLARHFLGIDLTAYVQMDVNMKQSQVNVNKINSEIVDVMHTLRNGTELLEKSENNTGVADGLSTKLHDFTGGAWGYTLEKARFKVLEDTYTKGIARAGAGGGKVPLGLIRDAEARYGAGLKSTQEYKSTTSEGQDIALDYAKRKIAEKQAYGYDVSDLLKEVQYHEAVSKEVNKNPNVNVKQLANRIYKQIYNRDRK